MCLPNDTIEHNWSTSATPDLFPNLDADPDEVHRRALIAEAEERGDLDPSCRRCVDWLYPAWPNALMAGPGHRASGNCKSGKYPHCSCDVCW